MEKVEVDGEYSDIVNFAMQHNYVPIIRSLSIKNITEKNELKNLKLKISTDPEFAYDWTTDIEVIEPGETLELDNINLKLSQSYLYGVTERVNGIIKISVFEGERSIFNVIKDISVLSFDQWGGSFVMPEILTSFVIPNNDYVISVIRNASELLKSWIGSSSFTGYQTKNANTVRKQAAAIYEALRQEKIAYSNPPASYEAVGQKVRMADAVLKQKLGTCLDLTLLYAACLEYVGINSAIIIIKGHAFLSIWLEDECFAECVSDDVSLITKRTADGVNEMCVVECTAFTEGVNIDFEKAVIEAQEYFIYPENFLISIDVRRARSAGIRPLPIAVALSDGGIEFKDTEIKTVEDKTRDFVTLDIDTGKLAGKYTKQQMWERKLLDMNMRNTLINFRVTQRSMQLIVSDIDKLEDALAAGEEFSILPKFEDFKDTARIRKIFNIENDESLIDKLLTNEFKYRRIRTFLTETELERQIKTLYSSAKTAMEENGANTLYIALGFLKWFETKNSDRQRYAPLVLWPVELVRKSSKNYKLRIRDEEPQFNITLLEMLKTDYGIEIGGLDPLPKDDSGIDMLKVITIMRKSVMQMPRWDVEELSFLGIFSFNHFIMWNDIHNRADDLMDNKIVKSLVSGKMEWKETEQFLSPKMLDETYSPLDIAVPVSADSSQMRAICLSVHDSSFVLHGPPGTGKSQTITNMISNALYHGKSVLFIAEKMAALSVVQKRLLDIGLGPFCLELHSNKAKKKDVLSQLDLTLNLGRIKHPSDYRIQAEKLYEKRKELNKIVNEVHKVQLFGFSLYDAISRSEQYEQYSGEIKFTESDIEMLSSEKFDSWIKLCEKLEIINKECGGICDNPLEGIELSNYSMNIKNEAQKKLKDYAEFMKEYSDTISECENVTGCMIKKKSDVTKFKEFCRVVIEAGNIPKSLIENNDITSFEAQVLSTCENGRKRDLSKNDILSLFNEEIFSYDYKADEKAWREAAGQWFIPRFFGQNKIYKRLNSYLKIGKLDKKTVPDQFTKMRQYEDYCTQVNATKNIFENLFGMIYNGGICSWDSIEKIYHAAQDINRCAGSVSDGNKGEVLKKIAIFIENGNTRALEEFILKTDKAERDEKEVSSLLNVDFSKCENNSNNDNFAIMFSQKARTWGNSIDGLRNWCTYNSLKKDIEVQGLKPLIDYIKTNKTDELMPVFYKSIYNKCAQWIIAHNECLSSFNGIMINKDIQIYKQYCTEFEIMTRNEIVARLSAQIPTPINSSSTASELGILQKAIKSGGRMMSLRKLFDSIPNLLRKLSPCMLMSPISVAQYIDPKYPPFDLIIFDEASQMPTCEAVGAIARGKNLVVVGDPKQLPPTSFFASKHIDENNIEQEDMESILDDCLALSMPQEHLLWHYRSRHESLIAFSNKKYYDNKLYTFPSPYDKISKVVHVQVDGYYDRGNTKQNRAEAEAIIKEVERRLKDPILSHQSIGIVTFSTAQQSLISDMLDDLFSAHPEYEEILKKTGEELFIKNLENVQGDERDVILFSIGYGPDKDEKVALNFGPLNRDGGWRRLNVAVSRARKEMMVFSVLRPEQIDLTKTRSEGIAGVKAFLEFAIRGTTALTVKKHSEYVNKDALISSIANKLKKLGYDVNTNIGCSEFKVDIGVIDPQNTDKYILGIMTDGISFASAGTARDRNIVQESVMKSLEWKISRIWAIDWFEDSDREIERIHSDILSATYDKEKAPEAVRSQPVDFEREDKLQERKLDTYTVCSLASTTGAYTDFLQLESTMMLMSQMKEVINIEAPISKTLLTKRIIDTWSIARAGNRINGRINEIIADIGNTGTYIYESNGFIYTCAPDEWRSFRVPLNDTQRRYISDIAPEELAAAIKYVMETLISVDKDGLCREVVKLFGYGRCTGAMKNDLSKGILTAIRLGYVKEDAGRIVVI